MNICLIWIGCEHLMWNQSCTPNQVRLQILYTASSISEVHEPRLPWLSTNIEEDIESNTVLAIFGERNSLLKVQHILLLKPTSHHESRFLPIKVSRMSPGMSRHSMKPIFFSDRKIRFWQRLKTCIEAGLGGIPYSLSNAIHEVYEDYLQPFCCHQV